MATLNKIIERFIEVAENEVGYIEKVSNANLNDKTANAGNKNYTKYGAWYEGGWANGLAWCAIFICWCAHIAGILNTIIPRRSSVDDFVSWFKAKKRWKYAASGYIPKRGDLIIFTNNRNVSNVDATHIELVTGVYGSRVYTIGGNTSGGSTLIANGGGVAKKNYDINYVKIYGYCLPEYPEEEEYMPESVKMKINGKITEVTAINHKQEYYPRLRDLEKIGVEVSWDNVNRIPVVSMPKIMTLKMTVNGQPVEVPNFQMNGTNYAGVRAIMESLGYKVTWDSKTHTVICNK